MVFSLEFEVKEVQNCITELRGMVSLGAYARDKLVQIHVVQILREMFCFLVFLKTIKFSTRTVQ